MKRKRFSIAFSFAGEKREFVEKVAAILGRRFGKKRILYDRYHRAEFSRHELAFYLPDLYEKESELIVVVFCPDYEKKEWCGLEWNAIFGLLKESKVDKVMLTRFKGVKGKGLHGLAGYTDLDKLTPEEAASLILERLDFNKGKAVVGRRGRKRAGGADAKTEGASPDDLDALAPKSRKAYEFDVCVSYAPDKDWDVWVQEKFVPRLAAHLRNEVGPVKISFKHQIKSGASWNPNLGRRVARSQLMLPILTATYFKEECCVHELALMFEREQSLAMEGSVDDYRMVIPIRLGDGVTFPDLVGRVNHLDFRQFADPYLPNGTARADAFNSKVQELAEVIAQTRLKLPDAYSDEWEKFTGDSFVKQLRPKEYSLLQPSRLFF